MNNLHDDSSLKKWIRHKRTVSILPQSICCYKLTVRF
jgi:hypothetical protein